MGFECPKCNADLGEAAISKETFKKRLKEKDDANELLKGELKTAKALADSASGLKTQLETVETEFAAYKDQASRTAALGKLGIDVSDEAGQKLESTFLTLYNAENGSLEGDEKKTFLEWLAAEDGARANPLLDRYFQEGDDTQVQTVDVGGKKGLFTNDTKVVDPPVKPGKKMSPGQLREFLQKMTPDEYRAWHKDHGAEYGQPPLPPKPTRDTVQTLA